MSSKGRRWLVFYRTEIQRYAVGKTTLACFHCHCVFLPSSSAIVSGLYTLTSCSLQRVCFAIICPSCAYATSRSISSKSSTSTPKASKNSRQRLTPKCLQAVVPALVANHHVALATFVTPIVVGLAAHLALILPASAVERAEPFMPADRLA